MVAILRIPGNIGKYDISLTSYHRFIQKTWPGSRAQLGTGIKMPMTQIQMSFTSLVVVQSRGVVLGIVIHGGQKLGFSFLFPVGTSVLSETHH